VAKPFEAQTLIDRVKQLLASAPAPLPAAVRPAAAPLRPAATPARSAPADDDAFDFFSDAPEQPAASPPPVPSADAFDLDGPDSAFAFGDDDLSADFSEPPRAMPPAASARRPDATIAILPDPPTAPDIDALEFSFGGADRAQPLDEPLDPGQLAHTTLLDPAAGAGFDVSSSDLSFSSEREPAAATTIFAMDDGPHSLPLVAEDAELDLAEAEPFDAPELDAPAPARAADPFATTLAPISRDPLGEAFDPFERDPFEDAPMVVAEPHQMDAELGSARPYGAVPESAREAHAETWDEAPFEPAAQVADESAAPSTMSAMARAELHDMLEKIAWDAFAPVTEKIVREALARVEQIVWEVVPKLAETLIQEEIRRLKGGS
jgi:hypothetical protein